MSKAQNSQSDTDRDTTDRDRARRRDEIKAMLKAELQELGETVNRTSREAIEDGPLTRRELMSMAAGSAVGAGLLAYMSGEARAAASGYAGASGSPLTRVYTQNLSGDGSAISVEDDMDVDTGVAIRGTTSINPDSMLLQYSAGSVFIDSRDGGSRVARMELNSSRLDLSDKAINLRISTGQAIEDGGGTTRLTFDSDQTRLWSETGQTGGTPRMYLKDGSYTRIYATSTSPFQIFDDNGTFKAVEYQTAGSAPGILELANADLRLYNGHQIKDISGNVASELAEISGGNRGWAWYAPTAGDANTSALFNNSMLWRIDETNDNLEFVVQYSGGAQKTGGISLS